MIADPLAYYGIDWLAMALSLLAVWLLGNGARAGFAVFAGANAVWIGLGVALLGSYGIVIGNVAFLAMNVRGYLRWTKTAGARATSP